MIAERKTTDETSHLWREFRANPTPELKQRLAEHFLPLLRSIARTLWHRLRGLGDFDDLVSAGYQGLVGAIDAFDPDRGFQFATFARLRIRGAMLDEIRVADWAPRLVRMQLTEVEQAERALRKLHSRPPSDEEIAELLGIDEAELFRRRAHGERTAVNSLMAPSPWLRGELKKEAILLDWQGDERSERPTARSSKLDGLRELVQGLRQTERLIVLLYYYEELTMKEIGASLGISESRVSQMHTRILLQLRERLERTRKH